MAQITWRNVDAPSNRDAFLGLEQAGNSFKNALSVLDSALKERQALNQAAEDRAVSDELAAFKNQLGGFTDAGALENAINSGELNARIGSMNTKNQAAAEEALRASLPALRDRTLSNIRYAATMDAENDKPYIAKLNGFIAAGDWAGATNFLASAEAKNIEDHSPYLKQIREGREATDAKIKADKQADEDREYQRKQDNLRHIQEQQKINLTAKSMDRQEKADKAADKAAKQAAILQGLAENHEAAKVGNPYAAGIGEDMSTADIVTTISKLPNFSESEKASLTSAIGKAIKDGIVVNGKRIPLPAAAVQAMLSVKPDSLWAPFGGGVSSRVEEIASAYANDGNLLDAYREYNSTKLDKAAGIAGIIKAQKEAAEAEAREQAKKDLAEVAARVSKAAKKIRAKGSKSN